MIGALIKRACKLIHKRTRLPASYWYSYAPLPLESGALGNTQPCCRPYQIKGSLLKKLEEEEEEERKKRNKIALFIEFWCFVPDDSLSHCFFPSSLNWNCVAHYFYPLWLAGKMKEKNSNLKILISQQRSGTILHFPPWSAC